MSDLNKEILERLYLEDMLTETQIGKMFGLGQVKVGRLRKKWGIRTILKSDRIRVKPLTSNQKELLIGSLLGDGWMSAIGLETARFQVGHSIKQEGYLLWKKDILGDYVSTLVDTNKDGHLGKTLVSITHRNFRPYYDLFYSEGKRVFPENLYELITPFALAVWYLDDGNKGGLYPRITFGLCDKSLERACEGLRSLGLLPEFHPDKRGGGAIRFPGQADKFFDLVRPHIPECMSYKVHNLTDRQKMFRNADKLTSEIAVALREGGFSVSAISKQYGVSENTVKRRLKGDKKGYGGRRSSYSVQAADISLSNIKTTKDSWSNLSPDEQESLINQAYEILSRTEFPYPELPSDPNKEWEKLVQMETYLDDDGFIRPQSYKGLPLCYPFFPNRYEARSGNAKTAYEAWSDERWLKRAIKLQLKFGDPVVPHRVLRAVTMNSRTPTVFRPGVAKYIVDNYAKEGSWVYDPCMGYGGRLLGTLSSSKGVKYLSTDVEFRTVEGNRKLAEHFDLLDRVELICERAENYNPDREVSLVYTSPPYFNAEMYSDNDSQSYKKHGTFNDWVGNFLYPLVLNSFDSLCDGGYLVINIADVKRNGKSYGLEGTLVEVADRVGFELVETLKMPISSLNKRKGFEPVFVFQKDYRYHQNSSVPSISL